MKQLFSRLRERFVKNRRTILGFLTILFCMVAISLISYFVLHAFGVMSFNEEGDMVFNPELFASFSSSFLGWVFFILLQTVLSMLLCIFPGVSMALIILSTTVIFPGEPVKSFILCFVSVAIASCTMYALGRFGGYRLSVKLVGKEDADHALDLLRDKGTFFFPVMMLVPFFPDEALTMVAGTVRMRLSWFLPSIFVARGIGIATIVFGISAIPFDRFTSPWHWVLFILAVIVVVGGILLLAWRFRSFITRSVAAKEKDPDTEA